MKGPITSTFHRSSSFPWPASLIPFLENDDANRMPLISGSNMQRQAVPLIKAKRRSWATGMERVTARRFRRGGLCKREGIVDQLDSERIHRARWSPITPAYLAAKWRGHLSLIKFKRSNQNTCITQEPLVRVATA